MEQFNFGVIDNRFLAKSLGLLNPAPPLMLSDESPIADGVRLLQQHKVGAIVVTNYAGKLAGIFTERDITLKVCLSGIDAEKTPLAEVMTKSPQTAEMTTSIAFALNMMSQGGYRHLPIIDNSSFPIGIVSVKDLVDYISHALSKDISKLA